MEEEIWKEIEGFRGIYQISTLAKVKSVDHFCSGRRGNGKQKGRILKQHISKKGYVMVSLSDNKIRFHSSVHRLLAIAFIPNPENKPQVNHINGIKHDNRLENLEWCTNSENQIHAVMNNLVKHNLGEKHHMSKLSNDDVKNARNLFLKGASNIELAKRYNISSVAMSNILRKKTYTNI